MDRAAVRPVMKAMMDRAMKMKETMAKNRRTWYSDPSSVSYLETRLADAWLRETERERAARAVVLGKLDSLVECMCAGVSLVFVQR